MPIIGPMVKVGIPRALSYYRYFPLWKTLLEQMGAQVVLSSHTGGKLLEDGVRHCVDDICVPVKLYYGHVLDLRDRADRIFISRVVSVEKSDSDTYTCPKLIGLPDMIKRSLEDLPPLLEFVIDVQNTSLKTSARRLADELGASTAVARKALAESLLVQSRFERQLAGGLAPEKAMEKAFANGNGDTGDVPDVQPAVDEINIGLVGHEYLIHDPYISHNLPEKLRRMNANAVLMSSVPAEVIERELTNYPDISWSYEKELLGAASHFLRRSDIDGVILVIGFACGPDSIIGEIINREVKQPDSPPLTTLVLDEHTGEAGVATRVEAFVDLIRRARKRL
jgi:predicted nucleotide-binding protein (sugar kinase/HSP70/actin superfamily)